MFLIFGTLGFFAIAYVPLCFSYGAELTFPLPPALINGTLTLIGSAMAFLISFIGAFFVKKGKDDDDLEPDELIKVQ